MHGMAFMFVEQTIHAAQWNHLLFTLEIKPGTRNPTIFSFAKPGLEMGQSISHISGPKPICFTHVLSTVWVESLLISFIMKKLCIDKK